MTEVSSYFCFPKPDTLTTDKLFFYTKFICNLEICTHTHTHTHTKSRNTLTHTHNQETHTHNQELKTDKINKAYENDFFFFKSGGNRNRKSFVLLK